VNAEVTYAVDVRFEGPPLRGLVEAQPYLAAAPSALWTEASALGDPVTVDLASEDAALTGVAGLTNGQVAGLDAGRLCWGVRLRGANVAASADGTLRAAYHVRTLSVRAGLAVF
jgi:hypothetical protein